MTSTASVQKAALSQALTQAKAALKGQGASESNGAASKTTTSSAKNRKPAAKAVTLSKRRLRKVRIRI